MLNRCYTSCCIIDPFQGHSETASALGLLGALARTRGSFGALYRILARSLVDASFYIASSDWRALTLAFLLSIWRIQGRGLFGFEIFLSVEWIFSVIFLKPCFCTPLLRHEDAASGSHWRGHWTGTSRRCWRGHWTVTSRRCWRGHCTVLVFFESRPGHRCPFLSGTSASVFQEEPPVWWSFILIIFGYIFLFIRYFPPLKNCLFQRIYILFITKSALFRATIYITYGRLIRVFVVFIHWCRNPGTFSGKFEKHKRLNHASRCSW